MRFPAALALAALLSTADLAVAATPDPWITTRVKIALFTAEALAGLQIDVDTVDGRVALHGKVESKEERDNAETIAKSVPDVKDVRNLLQVVPASRRQRTEATDQWVQREVAEKVKPFAEGRITVASVHDGVVLLAGDARSSAELLRALESARRVKGVRRVASEVRIASDDRELDVWNGHELKRDGARLIDVAGDIWTTAEVRLALYAEDDIPTADISVDTRNGIVTLFGSVATEDQKAEAEDEAEDVSGVRRVRNLLQVVPAKNQEEVKKTDDEIQTKVLEAIYARAELKGTAIRAAVRKRFVRLQGSVPSQQHRVLAASVARAVAGVRSVSADDLSVISITNAATPVPGPTTKR